MAPGDPPSRSALLNGTLYGRPPSQPSQYDLVNQIQQSVYPDQRPLVPPPTPSVPQVGGFFEPSPGSPSRRFPSAEYCQIMDARNAAKRHEDINSLPESERAWAAFHNIGYNTWSAPDSALNIVTESMPLVGVAGQARFNRYAGRYEQIMRGRAGLTWPATPIEPAPSGLGAAQSWGRPETLAVHFDNHGADFGSTNAECYAQRASMFLLTSQARGLPTKIDSSGIIRVYDPATNTFGAYNANGTTRTFFKPQPRSATNPRGHTYATNMDFWNAQAGEAPWQP
jgi:hypothetical protein